MKTMNLIILISVFPILSQAEMTAKAGIERLKQNVENSKSNIESYQKNLKVVEGNLSEISKAKSKTDAERSELNSTIKLNQGNLVSVEKQEKELTLLITQEEKETQNEIQKVKDLEKLIAQLKSNQDKRGLNITKYKQQLEQTNKEKSEWKTRLEQLAKQQKEMNDRVAAVKKVEKDWNNKKVGYDGEIGRWKKETDKHQKLYLQYSAMTHQ